MQTRTLLAAVAAAAIAAVVTPSISAAQDTTVKKAVSKGEVAIQPSYSSLVSAISLGSANADKIKALTSVNAADVQFVNVQDLLAGNSPDSLNAIISKNEDNIEALRKALGSNQALGLLLAPDNAAKAMADTTAKSTTSMPGMSMKPSAKDVVAADVTSDNKVVLYYWKKQ